MVTIVGPAYTVTNFYINQTEIAETLCENKDKPELHCNGHCYLKKQLIPVNEVNEDKEGSENRLTVIWPNAFNELDKVILSYFYEESNHYLIYTNHYKSVDGYRLFAPPQV